MSAIFASAPVAASLAASLTASLAGEAADAPVCAPGDQVDGPATTAAGFGDDPAEAAAPGAGGSPALRGIAETARAQRARLRAASRHTDEAAGAPSPDRVAPRDVERLARRAMGLAAQPGLGRLLVYLHHSYDLALSLSDSAPDPASDPASGTAPEAASEAARGVASQTVPTPARADAIPWLERAASLADAAGDLALAAHARLELAEILAAPGPGQRPAASERALDLARRAALEAARVPHPETRYRAHALLGRLHRAAGRRTRALEAQRIAVGILESMKPEIVARARDEGFSFRRGVEPIYRGLADLLLAEAARREAGRAGAGDAPAGDPAAVQALLREARDVIERSRQAELRDHFEDPCLALHETTRADEIPGVVVVHPIALEDRVELIVSREGRLTRHRSPLSGGELATLAESLRLALEDRLTRRYLPRAQALHAALIEPIAQRLAESPVGTLVFVPDAALRQLPMGVLHDRGRDRFLIEDHPIAVLPALSLTDLGPVRRSDVRLLGAGLSKAVAGFGALEHVDDELAAIEARFPGRVLLDEDFLARRLERSLAERPWDILHIASHGSFSSDPAASFVLAWDGPLPIDRLAAAIGQARFRTERPIELVVMSACETAAGDERAALGLAGAAIRMGARSVVASLWSVNDRATLALITRFYQALAEPGTSRAAALQAAQVALLRAGEFRHPIDWAAFVLLNSWL